MWEPVEFESALAPSFSSIAFTCRQRACTINPDAPQGGGDEGVGETPREEDDVRARSTALLHGTQFSPQFQLPDIPGRNCCQTIIYSVRQFGLSPPQALTVSLRVIERAPEDEIRSWETQITSPKRSPTSSTLTPTQIHHSLHPSLAHGIVIVAEPSLLDEHFSQILMDPCCDHIRERHARD